MKNMKLRFQILSDFYYLPFLTALFKKLKTKEPAKLTQILVEAFNNAVVHAHHRQKGKWIGIDLELSAKKAVMRVSDQGRGMKPSPKSDEMRNSHGWGTHGRGLMLMRSFATRTKNYKKGGRHIFEALRIYE